MNRRDGMALDARASPLSSPELEGRPPAGIDPLCGQGKGYSPRLAAAGVTVEHISYQRQVHGFASMSGVVDQGREALERTGASLAQAFAA